MVKGSCVCGDWTYQYEGDAAAVAVCHCIPCRKTAGTNGSVNSIVPNDQVNFTKHAWKDLELTAKQYKQISGTDRTFVRKGDSTKVRLSVLKDNSVALFDSQLGRDIPQLCNLRHDHVGRGSRHGRLEDCQDRHDR